MNRNFLLSILSLSLAANLCAQQIEAEAWTTQNGVQTEATTDIGGTLNVGWIEANDWTEYTNQPLAAGNWRLDARIATTLANRQIQVLVDGVAKITLTYAANTGGWQTWATASSATFNVATGGNHVIRLVYPGNSMNLNWVRFVAINGDVTAPAAVTGFNSPAKTHNTVNLAWTASADAGLSGYEVYRGGVLIAYLGKVTAYQATGLTANTAYAFTIKARDLANNLSAATANLNVTTNAAPAGNLLVNGDFAAGMNNWTLYQGTNLNVAGEYAVSTPVTANVYDVNVLQKLAMTQGTTDTLTFKARSNLDRIIVGGWGLAQAPWTNQVQTFNLTAAWQNYSMSLASTVPSDVSSRVFFDVGGAIAGEVHIDDVSLTTGTVDAQAPTVPANLASPSQTNTTINLTWTAATDNVGVTAYEVFKGGVSLVLLGNVTAYQAVGLTQNTAYAFTVRARDAAGNNSAQTAALNVSTANIDVTPPTVPAISSPAKSATTVDLAWTVATDNVGVTGYNVFRNGTQIASLAAVNNYQAVGLQSAVAYAFTVQAKDAAGNLSAISAPVNVTTLDNVPPSAPGNLASPAKTHNTVNLTWTAATDNVGVTAYDVLIGGVVFASPGNVLNFQAAGLSPNTTYTFTVRARDGANMVGPESAPLAVTTTNPDLSPPSAPTNLASPAQTNTTINLAWTPSTDNVGVTGYDVYKGGVLLSPNVAVANYQAVGLIQNTAYAFHVIAKDAAGNPSAASATLNVSTANNDIQAPTVPANLASPSQTGTTINLAWTAATDNVAVTGYDVFKGGVLLESIGAVTAYQAIGLTSATAYSFTVRAKDAAGNLSAQTAALAVSTSDVTAPTASVLSSTAQANTTINLAWTAATDNVGVTGYEVYKGGVLTATLGNVLAYQAIGLTAGTAYSFTVRARDAAGNWGPLSNALAVSTTNAAANMLTNGDFAAGVVAPWNPFPNPPNMTVAGEYAVNTAAGGNVYDVNVWQTVPMTQGVTYTLTFRARSNVNRTIVAGWGFNHAPWDNQNQIMNLSPAWQNYVITGVSTIATDPQSRVFFDVGAFAGEVHIDDVSLTNTAFVDNQVPTIPAGLTSPAQGQTTLNISWAASTDNVAVTGYEIWVNGALNATVGNVLTGTATGLAGNTAYSVQVKAFDAAGNKSALSTALAVSTTNGQGPLKIEAEAWTVMNGLQTENTTDVGAGLNVGWIDANDWAEYANQPLAAGTYKLEARVATMDVNRQVQLFVDGALTTTVTQAVATGGWQTWATAISADFSIATGGNHLVRLSFPGNNMNINWVRFVPSAPDVTAPSVPTGLATTGQGGTTISMTWNASTDAVGVTGYKLYANGVLNATVPGATTGTLTGLTASTQYQIKVSAFDGAGNESAQSAAVAVSTSDGSNLNGIYVMRNRNSAKCAEIQGGSLADGGAGIQNTCDGSRQQKWELVQVTATNYKLKNVNSAKLLDVKNAGATDDIQQWADGNGTAQIWRILPVAGVPGTYTLNATSDLTECLDVLNGSTAAGTALKTAPCNGQTRQQFNLIPTEAVTACVAGAAPGNVIGTQQWWIGAPFTQPMELVQEPAAAGGGWIVMDQTGMIRRMNDNKDNAAATTYLNWTAKVHTAGESGLASLAFDPDYANNHFVFITYISTKPVNGDAELRLSRFTSFADFKSLNAASEQVIWAFKQPADIHHSGSIVFGPGPVNGEKYMYLSVGDNGNNVTGDVTPVKVTDMGKPNGKILRFTLAEARGTTAITYSLANGTIDPKYVVATGLRNPWRTSFDGDDLWISNVGFDKQEEINKFNVKTDPLPNFGWPWCEGTLCCGAFVNCALPGMPAKPADNQLVWPIHEYPRAEGNTNQGAAIAGFVYRGTTLPGLVGKFIFADFVDKTVFALDPVTRIRTTIIDVVGDIADIGQDKNGEIMLTDYGASKVWKVIPGLAQPLTWPPQNLADAGCFTALDENQLLLPGKPGVNPFTVAQTFWSDGAKKQRYVSLPPGATIDAANNEDWKLPPGGVTIKNFQWPATGKLFETRLFVRHTNGVYAGYTYKWNGNAATLVGAAGDTKDLGGHVWDYPTRGQCMSCHNDKVDGSIALETRQLNVMNQLANMTAAGVVTPRPEDTILPFPKEDWASGTLKEQALSYLHVNCANCHRGPTESSAGRATWDARFLTPLAGKKACNELPFEAVSGDVANERIIKPGNSALSTTWLRAHVRDGNGMPAVGSKLVDQVGVQVLANWINGLTGCQ